MWRLAPEAGQDRDREHRLDGLLHPVRIARADVETIGERADGIVVRARGGAALVVPRELEGYARLREALAGWAAGRRGAGPASPPG